MALTAYVQIQIENEKLREENEKLKEGLGNQIKKSQVNKNQIKKIIEDLECIIQIMKGSVSRNYSKHGFERLKY